MTSAPWPPAFSSAPSSQVRATCTHVHRGHIGPSRDAPHGSQPPVAMFVVLFGGFLVDSALHTCGTHTAGIVVLSLMQHTRTAPRTSGTRAGETTARGWSAPGPARGELVVGHRVPGRCPPTLPTVCFGNGGQAPMPCPLPSTTRHAPHAGVGSFQSCARYSTCCTMQKRLPYHRWCECCLKGDVVCGCCTAGRDPRDGGRAAHGLGRLPHARATTAATPFPRARSWLNFINRPTKFMIWSAFGQLDRMRCELSV